MRRLYNSSVTNDSLFYHELLNCAVGKLNESVVPVLGNETISMVLLCNCMIRCAIAKPSPVPSV